MKKIKIYNNNPHSHEAINIKEEIQNLIYSEANLIVDVKYIQTPIRYEYHLYVYNEILPFSTYITEDEDFWDIGLFIQDQGFTNKQIQDANYFQWTKCQHKREDWVTQFPKFTERYNEYSLNKLIKLLEKK